MEDKYLIALIIYGTLLLLTLVGIIIIFMVLHKRRTRRYQEELLRTRVEVQEQALDWVSREIHDNIGQVLSIIRMQLNYEAPGKTKQELVDEMIQASGLIEQCINDLRNMSHTLNGEMIEKRGLTAAIKQELSYVHSLYKLECDFIESGEVVLDSEGCLLLFRIIQECLNNIVRHAEATAISVTLTGGDHGLELSIEDNGKGMDMGKLAESKGMGLVNIRERTHLLGGKLHILSGKEKGSKITVTLKLSQDEKTRY
ncbi:MAG: hypothetical protein EPN39_11990 [Chitinophagaceae bacterium]|nr:MAG: hypothetical protein EPN39_11990 [Chitinophagaceae bacterium]